MSANESARQVISSDADGGNTIFRYKSIKLSCHFFHGEKLRLRTTESKIESVPVILLYMVENLWNVIPFNRFRLKIRILQICSIADI